MPISKTFSKIISLCLSMVLALGVFAGMPTTASAADAPLGLSGPSNPRWDLETGEAIWDNNNPRNSVKSYAWQLYRSDEEPDLDYMREHGVTGDRIMSGNDFGNDMNASPYRTSRIRSSFREDGYYYFTVCAVGDRTNYTDSANILSINAFYYGEPVVSGDKLSTPANVKWEEMDYGSEYGNAKGYYATWSNLFSDDYADDDYFRLTLYNESEEIVASASNWSKHDLEERHEEWGETGIFVYDTDGNFDDHFLDSMLPNGKYRFTVQAIRSRPNEYRESDVSESSGWHEIGSTTTTPPTVTPPVVTPGGGAGGSSSSSSSSRSRSSSSSSRSSSADTSRSTTTTTTTTSTTITSSNIKASSKGSGETTVQAAAWKKLNGQTFQHSTVINGKTEVRITINNPASISKDLKVSGYTTGSNVDRITSKFNKHFSNKVSVLYFDQTGVWGQEIRVAAKLDLSGMDTDNLVFYTYDSATNTYQRITAPNYTIDSNGFIHFSTSYAGSIVVSDGPLVKK